MDEPVVHFHKRLIPDLDLTVLPTNVTHKCLFHRHKFPPNIPNRDSLYSHGNGVAVGSTT